MAGERHREPDVLLDFLPATVREFAGSQPQSDDITALTFAVRRIENYRIGTGPCPKATRKRIRRSTEYPRNWPASIADTFG